MQVVSQQFIDFLGGLRVSGVEAVGPGIIGELAKLDGAGISAMH
jgi:hypothetical protein